MVNVKDAAGAKSGSNNCVVLQDGRASNISIVSTESSDLGSPNSPVEDGLFEPPPDLPAKIRLRSSGSSGYDPQHFVRESDYQRSRGGEHSDVLDGDQDEEEEEEEEENSFLDNHDEDNDSAEIEEDVDGEPIGPLAPVPVSGGLAGYFTSSLESSTPSRRGRPPVIRAAERHRRQLVREHYEGEEEDPAAYGFEHHFEGGVDDFHISEVGHQLPDEVYDEMYEEEDELVDDEYDPQVKVQLQ